MSVSADGDMSSPVIGDDDLGGPLTISPQAPVLMLVVGQPLPTQQFTATAQGATVTPTWGIDRGEIGSIDSNGLFTTPGTFGGLANISAVYGGQKVTTTINVLMQLSDNGDPNFAHPPDGGAGGYGGVGGDGPGGMVTPLQQTTLTGTATVDATVKLLYPYDQTVWPRGLLPPLLQWNSGTHHFDSAYITVTESSFTYSGFFAANNAGNFVNLVLPDALWAGLTYSNGGEPVVLSITFAEGDKAYGPYSLSWKIAPATLRGTVYYNSYGTFLVKNSDGNDKEGHQYGAGTLAIKAGATAPVLVAGTETLETDGKGNGNGCRVCHTVNAKGSVLLTQHNTSTDTTDYHETDIVNLLNDTTMGAGTAVATSNLAFPALSPDGTLLLSSGGTINSQANSSLFSLPSGNPVTGVMGLPADLVAVYPAFSPDGAHVSFNYGGGTFTGLTADQISLAMIDFDGNKTFSNPQILYKPDPSKPVTWSSFLPDEKGVVFETELSNPSGNFGFTWAQNTGELWWVDIASKSAHRLDRANGINLPDDANANGHGPGIDTTLNYEPTVNPIASGGYAWVVFTSRRLYGNVATNPPWQSDPRGYNAATVITTKKLWVAAIDLNAGANVDPSHPAFYLPGQEIHAGNSRGFWTVDPCHADGKGCVTGDECCGGYCEPGGDGGLVCGSTPPVCSAQFEKCTTAADCCSGPDPIDCINGICTLSSPPIP